jgi:hypothetical protein
MNKDQLDNATTPRSVDQQQACSPACPFCGASIEYDGVNFVRYGCDSSRDKPTKDNFLQRSVRCTHSTDSTARLLLFRWSDWARAHSAALEQIPGHAVGIADDTREFLRGYFALQAESQANSQFNQPELH